MASKVWIIIGVEALIFAVLLFGAAGTICWPAGWAFLVLFFGCAVLMTLMLARRDPALLEERLKPLIQKGQPLWDKVLMSIIAVLYVAWLILMGLDAVRFGWSTVPGWLQWVGAAGILSGLATCYGALEENTFAAPVVRIQTERHQTVISTGPYAIVRHPLYTGALVFLPSNALLLGSWWGLAASGLIAGGVVIRTALEDRELKRRLEGYEDYAARVRYRLVPFVW